jgi:catechol 2,3-dioxygenase-like lactoylglutathione lyase family enzyme
MNVIFSRISILVAVLALSPAAMASDRPLIEAVTSVGMTVRDLDKSIQFFTSVLSFEKLNEVEVAGEEYERLTGVFGVRMRIAQLKLGDEFLELNEYLAPRGRAMPADSRSNDHWFQHIAIVVRDMDKAYRHLRQHKVEHASTGPQRLPAWNTNAAGIQAFYFRDPDGHFLEVIQFPAGKGDPRWHQETDRLFLGIDHTAIVVANTEASLRFYRDQIGMKVVGENENYGTEQEHLNNVFGARLKITTMRAAKGPGIEFLDYLAPRDGRPIPNDTRANDQWHWHVSIRGGCNFIESLNPVRLLGTRIGLTRAARLRDPDGHALLATND